MMPKAILKILKVLTLEKMSFSHKAIDFYMPLSQNVQGPLCSALQNLSEALFKSNFLCVSQFY